MITRAAEGADLDLSAALGSELATRISTVLNPRARRMSLRLDPAGNQIVLVRPRRASDRTILNFVASRKEWIKARLDSLPPRIVFADGVHIPIAGQDHVLKLAPEKRGGVWREGETVFIAGQPEFAARRVKEWLKSEARRMLTPMVQAMATVIERKVKHVTVRDTTSRWGSCSSDGKLSFSWRLVLAPIPVLTYVAAHEVAHLKHLNHSDAFWRTVDDVLDAYEKDPARRRETDLARDWLQGHGAGLHRYG